MHSKRTEGDSENVWTPGEWILIDIEPYPTAIFARITVYQEGYAIGRTSDEPEIVNEAWNSLSPNCPDPENYECKLSSTSGFMLAGGDVMDEWLPLSQTRSWTFPAEPGPGNTGLTIKQNLIRNLRIRKVGGVEVKIPVQITLYAVPEGDL